MIRISWADRLGNKTEIEKRWNSRVLEEEKVGKVEKVEKG